MIRARLHRLAFAAAVLLALPASGCQALLGIKDPVVGGDGAAGGRDASGPADGRPGMADGPLHGSDGGAGNPDAAFDGGPPVFPSPRGSHVMAYDSARHRLVLFGGIFDANILGDTWEWDGSRWKDVTPATTNPPPRAAAMMAYDAPSGEVVLFGGYDHNNNPLGDTWEWNGTRWKDVTPAPPKTPPARSAGAMVYDATRKRLVLFGGTTVSASLNDTWEWDGTSWTNVTPASGNPPVRESFGMAYDAQSGQSVAFSGLGAAGADLNDTWAWDGATWTYVTGAADPPARDHHLMAFDAKTGRVVLFGGNDAAGRPLNDTWARDNVAWSDVTPSSGNPPLSEYAMAYDPDIQRVLLYGGGPDLYEWDGTSWTDVMP